MGKLGLPAIAFAVIVLFIVMGITCVALYLGRMEISDGVALAMALIGSIAYSVRVITSRSFSIEAVFVAIVLAGTMVLVLARKTEWNRYIADAYIMALPVQMIYECIMNPLYRLLKKDLYLLSPFITVPQTSIFSKVGNLLHVDLLVWSGFFFVLSLLPVIYLSGGRKEGKIRR
ncbi:MAG: hypothetical protein IK109_11330 [Clostridiales bacterium]|nr:hypothetical protein [Clostridiales bacterium]MBR5418602.1 hypothetical protein [Clostridiales bacterium]